MRKYNILGRTPSTLEVAAKGISGAAKIAGHEAHIRHFATDITDADAVSRVFEAIRDEFNTVDIVINNAGGLHLGTIEASDNHTYFDANVKGTLHVIQSFLRFGLDRNAAVPITFINHSTVGIATPTMPTWLAYVASKLAAFTMTAFLGAETGGALRVFSVHPGRIATDMSSKAGVPTFDDAGLPGAFCIWLAATPEADFLESKLVACNWDVDELLQMKDEIVGKELLKLGVAGLSV